MSIFGDLERAFADLYPYRWLFASGLILVIAVSAGYAYRMGWHRFLWGHRLPTTIIGVPALVVVVWGGWSLGSPLFTNTTVDEAFPFAVAAAPSNTDTKDGTVVVEAPSALPAATSPVGENVSVAVASTPSVQPKNTPVAAAAERTAATAGPTINLEPTTTPSPPPTNTPGPTAPIILKAGEFQDIDGFHKGTGTATIYLGEDGSRVIRFEDFKVTNGPDLHVVLSPYGGPQEVGGRLKSPGWIDLGKLKGNIGNQNYVIPEDVDIGIHNSVTIWCQPFNVIFSVAVLREVS